MTHYNPKGKVFRVVLPVPPSANALYTYAGPQKRVRSSAYNDWLCGVIPVINIQPKPTRASLPFHQAEVLIKLCINYTRDTDNCTKPIFDALEKAGVLRNDRYVEDHRVKRVTQFIGGSDLAKREALVIVAPWGTGICDGDGGMRLVAESERKLVGDDAMEKLVDTVFAMKGQVTLEAEVLQDLLRFRRAEGFNVWRGKTEEG